MSAEDRQDQASSSHGPEEKQKCCIGALFFSQALHRAGRSPVCAGIPRTLQSPRDIPPYNIDTIPGGDFKYVCVGVSLFDDERLRRNREALKRSPTDPVELPYCEGLEIISAAELQETPVTLNDSGEGHSAAQAADDPHKSPAHYPPDGRGGNRIYPYESPMRDLTERWLKSSKRVLRQMQKNAILLPSLVKKSCSDAYGLFQKARESVRDRDRDE